MAYWSFAPSIMRRVSRHAVAWERLRARRKLGTAMEASRAMIATTIMISTRVKPPRRLLVFVSMFIEVLLECNLARCVLHRVCCSNKLLVCQRVRDAEQI